MNTNINKDSRKMKSSAQSFELEFDDKLEGFVFNILDLDGMYPCYWRDPEAGLRKIVKTKARNVQMV